MSEIKHLLKKTSFRFLWTSQVFSQIAINMMNFLILIRLFDHTGSTLAVSFLWISYAIPTIIIGPIAYAAVDLMSRKKVLLISNLFQGLLVFSSSFIVDTKIFLLYGVTFLYSLLNQFYVPAETAMLPRIVKKKYLPNAVSVFLASQQIALIVGFSIAGFLVNYFDFEMSFLICSALLFLATISTFFLPNDKTPKLKGVLFEDALKEFFGSLFKGYVFIKSKNFIYIPFLLLLGVHACFAVVMVNVPVITQQILRMDTRYSSILLVVPAGVGALLGATYFPKFFNKGWRKRMIIDISSLVLGSLFAVYLTVLDIMPLNPRLIVSFIATLFVGIFFMGILIPTQTFLQEVTPDKLRGRVFGNMWFLITLAQVIPIIFSGILVEIFGIRFLLAIISLYCWSIFYTSRKTGVKLQINTL